MMARSPEPSFTAAVRQELARLPFGTDVQVRAELAAIVRHAGSLTVHGGTPMRVELAVATTSGAVARRTFGLVQHRYGARPELLVRAAGGVQRNTTYGVRIGGSAEHVARDLQVVDAGGAPVDELPKRLEGVAAVAYLRGALLAAGSISAPGRDPHLEIATTTPAVAAELAALLERIVDGHVTATQDQDRSRVVIKSGATIGDVLAAVGATTAFLTWDDRRLRRQLRSDANRLANADAANLRRSVAAATTQVAAVEAAIANVGWDALDDDLRGVALARLANPGASLAELGELVDPPVGKSAVHRRLKRLEALAARPSDPADGGSRR
jgi:cell division protein WhiA